MVPDRLPLTSYEPSEHMRRARALVKVRRSLTEATIRLNEFTTGKNHTEIIKRVHTAKTEIVNDNDDPEIVTYYSLWTDFSDMRLTESGELLKSDYAGKYEDVRQYGADKSTVVTLDHLRVYDKTYKTTHLLSLANQLDKFLRPEEVSDVQDS